MNKCGAVWWRHEKILILGKSSIRETHLVCELPDYHEGVHKCGKYSHNNPNPRKAPPKNKNGLWGRLKIAKPHVVPHEDEWAMNIFGGLLKSTECSHTNDEYHALLVDYVRTKRLLEKVLRRQDRMKQELSNYRAWNQNNRAERNLARRRLHNKEVEERMRTSLFPNFEALALVEVNEQDFR